MITKKNNSQTSKQPDKGTRSERQKRLGAALRENLRKRKSQSQQRDKHRVSES
jgi:hypothetical protein